MLLKSRVPVEFLWPGTTIFLFRRHNQINLNVKEKLAQIRFVHVLAIPVKAKTRTPGYKRHSPKICISPKTSLLMGLPILGNVHHTPFNNPIKGSFNLLCCWDWSLCKPNRIVKFPEAKESVHLWLCMVYVWMKAGVCASVKHKWHLNGSCQISGVRTNHV